MQNTIDLPDFLPRSSTSRTVAAVVSNPHATAADFSSAPGMALTHATQSEPLSIPRFLNSAARQTQHASDGNAFRTTGLAIPRGGVAEPREQRDETDKTDLPKHDEPRDHRVAIEPELAGVVISINSENVERTS